MWTSLVTAIRTLTIVPVRESSVRIKRSHVWFPLVGGMIGGLLWGAGTGVQLLPGIKIWSWGAAFLLLILSVLITGGLHLDGLADWADGFFGARESGDVLRIMKDPSTGAFGVVALILVLAGKLLALERLVSLQRLAWVVPAFVVSRFLLVHLAYCHIYARSEQGTGKMFVEEITTALWVGALLMTFAGVLLFPPVFLVLFVGAWVVARLFGFWSRRRIGGVTGDVLGACCEITELMMLFAAAWLPKTETVLNPWFF